MAIKFSELPLGSTLLGSEIIADVQGGDSVQHTMNNVFNFISTKYTYGDGILFTSPNTISVDANLSNLKFQSGVLNTIQDINLNSTPTFNSLLLSQSSSSSFLTIRNTSGVIAPTFFGNMETPSPVSPFSILNIIANGQSISGTPNTYGDIQFVISDNSDLNPSGSLNIDVLDNGSLDNFICFDGNTSSIIENKRMQNLVGYQSFQENLFIALSQNVDNSIIGRTVVNNTLNDLTLTLTFNNGIPIGSSFEMLKTSTGNFDISAQSGVILNDVTAGSFSLTNPNSRLVLTKIGSNDYVYVEYSGSGTSGVWQDIYNNSLGNESFIQLNNEPFQIRDSLSNLAYSFESDTSLNNNVFRLVNSAGTLEFAKQNLSSPGPQGIGIECDIALNDAASQIIYVNRSSSVISSTTGLESGLYEIGIQEAVSPGIITYLQLDGQSRTAKVPNNSTKILEPIATTSDISGVTLQSAYDAGNSIVMDGLNDIIISGPGPTEMFRFENGLIVSSAVPLRVDNLITIQSNVVGSPANLAINLDDVPFSTSIVGDITFNSLDSLSSALQYGKIEYSVGDPTVGSRSSIVKMYSYHNDSQQSIFVYDGTDNSTKIRDPISNLLEQIVTVGDVTLQVAYDNGNTIQLDGVNNFIINDSSSQSLFICSDTQVSSFKDFVIRKDDISGPLFLFENLINGSIGDILLNINSNGKASNGDDKTNILLRSEISDDDTGSFSTNIEIDVFDNGANVPYILIDGSIKSIKVPNFTTKVLDEVATLFDINNVDLQDAYDNGNGEINLIADKPFKLLSTVAGFSMPTMSGAQFDAILNPDSGLIAWDDAADRFRVNKGSPSFPLYDQLAYITDVQVATSNNFGEMYFNGNGSETIIVTQGIPVKVNATYQSGLLDNFSQSSGTLTFTGLDTKSFRISASVTCALNLVNDKISVLIFVNGSEVTKATQSAYLGSVTPDQTEITVQSLFTLNSGDTIEIFVQNDTSTNNITVESLNCNITQATGTFDASTIDLQIAYNNGNGQINVVNGKPFGLNSTEAGFFLPSMTNAQFDLISSPHEGLMAWSNDNNRIRLNKGTPGSPVYDEVAYVSDVTGSFSVDSVLGVMIAPNTTQIEGVWQSMFSQVAGSFTIPANSIQLGDTYILSVIGVVASNNNGGSGNVRLLLNGSVKATSVTTSTSSSGQTQFKIDYTLTRTVPGSSVLLSGYGIYERTGNHVIESLRIMPSLIQSVDYTNNITLDIEFKGNYSGSNFYQFQALFAKLVKSNGSVL